MRKEIEKIYVQAIVDDLPPSVFSSKIMELFVVEQKEIPSCLHPTDKREGWHDSSILCLECNSIIEQFGKIIEPPTKL